MKKLLLLVVLVGGGGWWYFIGGRTITEDHVNRFYEEYQAATLDRKPEVLCAMLAADFQGTGSVEVGGQTRQATQNKDEACKGFTDTYAIIEKLGEKMGGIMQLDSSYKISSIEIQPDRKSAIVEYVTSMDVGGTVMNIRSRDKDTLIRRNGKVLMLRNEATGSIRSGG